MRLLITGAAGMLGSAVQAALGKDFDIIAASRADLNIQSFLSAKAYLQQIKPDVILHAAAYTNVEEAERQPADCYRVNYNGTLHLANAAKALQAKFIYISSTGCYGSYSDEPYTEYQDVVPTTVYHRSKFLGEDVVRHLCADFLILRTGWLFGGSVAHKKNFVNNRYKEASLNTEIMSDPFQRGNPTNTADVAAQVQVLIDNDIRGIFNVVSGGSCSRFEYVQEIVAAYGLTCKVKPADQPFQRLARVSHNEAAFNFNLDAIELNVMPPWKESLREYIQTINTGA
ncbi:MAG: SDR family oxidoreductase [Chitinophagaceae bacterium]